MSMKYQESYGFGPNAYETGYGLGSGESPKRSAEGARRKLKLSGKRTEQRICVFHL